MKLKDIQPHTVYAVFNRRSYDNGRRYAGQMFFTPQQLNHGLTWERKLKGFYLKSNYYRGNDVRTWGKGAITPQEVQMPWHEYLAMKAEDEAREQRNREASARAYAESVEKGEALEQYLKDNRAALEAAGLPLPGYIASYQLRGGRLEITFTQEQLESLLSRLSQEVTA